MQTKHLRILLLIVIAVVVGACNAAASTPTATPTNLLTVTPIPATVIESQFIIITATQQDPNAPTWTPYPTFTPYPSLTPCPSAATCPTLDADQLRATQIIVGATATQQAILAATTPVATRTPLSTLTANEVDSIRSQGLNELETALGFSHPSFEDVVDEFIRVNSPEYVRSYHFQPQIHRITHENATYVAVVPVPAPDFSGFGSQFLLFRVNEDSASLIFEYTETTFTSIVNMSDNGFEDYNANGYPDLAIFSTWTVACAPPMMMLLIEIRDNDEVVDLTPKINGQVSTTQAIDLDDDGILEIQIEERFNVPYILSGSCNFAFVDHYFAWDGTAYVDISATLDESYYPVIGRFWDNINIDDVCLIPTSLMYEMLLSYYVRGTFVEAWERLQSRLRWDECSSEILTARNWEITAFEGWVTSFLPQSTPSP